MPNLPASVRLFNTNKLNIFGLNWYEDILPIAVKDIADEIQTITTMFSDIISADDKYILGELSHEIKKRHNTDYRPPPRKSTHRLTALIHSPMKDVSEATGIHPVTLSKIAKNRGYNPTLELIDKLCEYFDCELTDLLLRVNNTTELTK
jgi:putative transcriptional regulator